MPRNRSLRHDARPRQTKPESTDREDTARIPEGAERGIVIRAHGLWYEVLLEAGERVLIATIRGALKRKRRRTDIVAVGDRVWVTDVGEGEGVIEHVAPRTRVLSRLARNTRDIEQVIIANPDQVLFVFAAHDPEPHRRMLDRFIILAELQQLPVLIGIGKMDLDTPDRLPRPRELFADYESLYPVYYFSTVDGTGIDELHRAMMGKLTVIAGPSGVGKSSLLNVLDPDNRREVSQISDATGKGRHTTVGARLQRIDDATFLGDTPGMRALAMRAVPGDELPACFIEFRPFLGLCYYEDCAHVEEPDCAVREAVDDGKISRERYESYLGLRTGGELDDPGSVG